jgi:hypothetical protein
MEPRWLALIIAEIVFSGLMVGFLFTRYWFEWRRTSAWLLGGALANDALLVVLGAVDFLLTGHWSLYQTLIALFLVYAVIWGRRDLRRLDALAARVIPALREERRAQRRGRR